MSYQRYHDVVSLNPVRDQFEKDMAAAPSGDGHSRLPVLVLGLSTVPEPQAAPSEPTVVLGLTRGNLIDIARGGTVYATFRSMHQEEGFAPTPRPDNPYSSSGAGRCSWLTPPPLCRKALVGSAWQRRGSPTMTAGTARCHAGRCHARRLGGRCRDRNGSGRRGKGPVWFPRPLLELTTAPQLEERRAASRDV